MRNRWRKGTWLIIDSESGMTRSSDKVKKDYAGLMVTKRYADYEQPQDFIKAERDPMPIPFSLSGVTDFTVDVSASGVVGNTSVPAKTGPATHLFR